VARDPPVLSVGQMSSATARTFIERGLAPPGYFPAGRGAGGEGAGHVPLPGVWGRVDVVLGGGPDARDGRHG